MLIGEVSTGVIVALLIVLNVVLGSRQELKARASVDALAKLQVPQARVVRDGQVQLIPATDIVPGDVIDVEAGDIIPADGRILRSATLETQEAALTGESAPIPKGANVLDVDRRRAGRSDQHAVPEHLGHQGHRIDGGHRDRHADPDGSDRHHADHGHADQIAAAEGARLAHQGARIDRLGRGRGDHRRRTDPRHSRPGAAAAGHGDGDLGHPDRAAGLRVGAAVDGREAAGRSQGGREEPHRRRDPRRHQRDQHRQDRNADPQPDDGVDAVRERILVHRGRRGLRQDRPDHLGRRRTRARFHQAGAGAGAGHRRRRRRRRLGDRRSDRGRPGGPGGQDRGRRRRDPPRLPAARRGAVRLRVQVHGDVPPDHPRRRRAHRRAGQGCAGCRPCPLHDVGRPAERLAGSDQRGRAGHRGGQRKDGSERAARARFRHPTHRRRCGPGGDDQRSDVADPRSRLRGNGRDHRSAAGGGQGRGHGRAGGRHRRPDDHRRPCRHRPGDRAVPRPGSGCDQRRRAAEAVRRRIAPPAARNCTCSAG